MAINKGDFVKNLMAMEGRGISLELKWHHA